MSRTSSLDRQRHAQGRRRARAAAPRAAALLSIAVLAIPALAGTPAVAKFAAPEPRCRDFNRFGEHWQLCRGVDGAVERHRIGLLP